MNLSRNITKLVAILAVSFAPVRAQEQAVEFDAKITEIKISRRYDSKTIVTGVDPRFLVRVILQEDAAGIGKSGDTVNFAIHSPARDLLITNLEEATGKPIRLSLVQASATLKILRRAKAKNAQQTGVEQPATRPVVEPEGNPRIPVVLSVLPTIAGLDVGLRADPSPAPVRDDQGIGHCVDSLAGVAVVDPKLDSSLFHTTKTS